MEKPYSLLTRACHFFPDKTALISSEKTLSFAEFSRACSALHNNFSQLGINPGDRVAILSPNSWQMLVIIHALIEYGATVSPQNTRNPANQIQQAVITISPHIIFYENSMKPLLPRGSHAICIEEFIDKLSRNHTVIPPKSEANFKKPASIIFTSGSASQPKAAVHSYENHFYSALGSQTNIPVTENDRWLLSLPLYHIGGLAISFRTFLAGGAIVIPANRDSILQNIAKFKITHISLVAAQLHRLLQQENAVPVLKKCKAILLGGSAISPALLTKAQQADLPMHCSYGSTEMSSQITATAAAARENELKTSGRVLPGREVKISPENDIYVRGETRFLGYLENGKLALPFDREGYFHTGDLGYFDAQKNLVVTGRKDNMFISGGENIQPEEIEKALVEIEGVAAAIVVAVPHAEFGQRPVSFVKWNGEPHSADKLSNLLEKKLARFKIPDSFLPWPDEIQMTELKIDRQFFKSKAADPARC
ncbi:MAG: o-succinylbenzoate--CoA ligase [Calditrichaeota bacterium]|nr:MAG: o-succinylbenzoate--CoA ligase [Calditrichota bacterium]